MAGEGCDATPERREGRHLNILLIKLQDMTENFRTELKSEKTKQESAKKKGNVAAGTYSDHYSICQSEFGHSQRLTRCSEHKLLKVCALLLQTACLALTF